MALVEGKAYWASVTTPNTTFDPIYSVDLVVDEETASQFEAIEHSDKPFVTIDNVQVFVEDLPEEGQAVFGRLQRLNQKKANSVLDVEEYQAGINFFSNRLVAIYNEEDPQTETQPNDTDTADS